MEALAIVIAIVFVGWLALKIKNKKDGSGGFPRDDENQQQK